MSLLLCIDSSMENASVSISREGSVLQHLTNNVQKDHAAFLHVAIAELLKKHKLKSSDLDAVAVSSGPGSYTGLRVGFAAAKGLSFALNKPLISIGTLEMMAKAVQMKGDLNPGELFCPMIDARRAEVYTGLYTQDIETVQPPHALILTAASFEDELLNNKIFFFGNGVSKFQQIVSNANAVFLEMPETISALAALAFYKFNCHDFVPVMSAAPQYVKEFYNR